MELLGEVEFIGTDIDRTGIDSDYEGTYALQFKKADGSLSQMQRYDIATNPCFRQRKCRSAEFS